MTELHGTAPEPVTHREYAQIPDWPGSEQVGFLDERKRRQSGYRVGGYLFASTADGPKRWRVSLVRSGGPSGACGGRAFRRRPGRSRRADVDKGRRKAAKSMVAEKRRQEADNG